MKKNNFIEIRGASMHNLKNISLSIPKKQLVVITGVSGSGKSSLAFDTIYAEGQRKYVESLSSYSRQFLERIEKPKVEKISGLSPAIALKQKVSSSNPRSTVGTKTEIYDYLKLLFSRYGKVYSPISGNEVKKDNLNDILNVIKKQKEGDKLLLLVEINKFVSTNFNEIKESLIRQNYNRVFINDMVYKISELNVEDIKAKSIKYLVIDRIIVNHSANYLTRVTDSIELALFEGSGKCHIKNISSNKLFNFNTKLELDGKTFVTPDTNFFSFNNPYGACEKCKGFGNIIGIDEKLVVPNTSLSIYDNAVFPWRGKKLVKYKNLFIKKSEKYKFPIHKPYYDLSVKDKELLWDGNDEIIGINEFFKKLEKKMYKIQNRVLLSRYRGKTKCDSCKGNRLKKEAAYVKINQKNIFDLINMPLIELKYFFDNLKLKQNRILNEIIERLDCLIKLGLDYLTLNRRTASLSGGESQRIELATCLGSNLTGSLYVLDEPSIGLHPEDTSRLIEILKKLRDLGNTVIVVEHDNDIIKNANYIIDIGPNAGYLGGEIVGKGILKDFLKSNSLTSRYLSNKLKVNIPKRHRKFEKYIEIRGMRENNLKNISVKIPLYNLVTITGVSGSGKSTVINKILYPAILNKLDDFSLKPGEFDEISGDFNLIKFVEYVSQKSIGISSRSNPVTYIKAYDDIRKFFASNRISKLRGYKPKHFSFNVDGGRCDNCKGEGVKTIEMQFMPDISMTCEYCNGNRFKNEILEVKIEGKNIADILDLTVSEAINYFSNQDENKIVNKLQVLKDVGLGYIKLGQSSSTLSGGEAQRVKLSYFLSLKNKMVNGLFLFDEPTTGLHHDDINKLLQSLFKLVENGNSVVIIEHNLEIIKCSDYIIDLGPYGGKRGGEIMFCGNIEEMKKANNFTAKHLKKILN